MNPFLAVALMWMAMQQGAYIPITDGGHGSTAFGPNSEMTVQQAPTYSPQYPVTLPYVTCAAGFMKVGKECVLMAGVTGGYGSIPSGSILWPEPIDIPPIRVPAKSRRIVEQNCNDDTDICMDGVTSCTNHGTMVFQGSDLIGTCKDGYTLTCEKGSGRILMEDVDGGLHCLKFPK